MKLLFAVGLILVAGCAAPLSMDELETEALQTGDWSKVEKRELLEAQRVGRARAECPEGYAIFCKAKVSDEDCECVSRDAYKVMFNESIAVQPSNPSRTGQ